MSLEIALAFGKSFLFVFAAILPILNPAATAPIFLGLTEGASASTRKLLARRIARNMFALMVGSMLVGSYVLDFFGISLPIVRVGGGLIVAASAWRLLNAGHATQDSRTELAEAFTPEQARRQAFYPLTFPISCGPGSIAAAITARSSGSPACPLPRPATPSVRPEPIGSRPRGVTRSANWWSRPRARVCFSGPGAPCVPKTTKPWWSVTTPVCCAKPTGGACSKAYPLTVCSVGSTAKTSM